MRLATEELLVPEGNSALIAEESQSAAVSRTPEERASTGLPIVPPSRAL